MRKGRTSLEEKDWGEQRGEERKKGRERKRESKGTYRRGKGTESESGVRGQDKSNS